MSEKQVQYEILLLYSKWTLTYHCINPSMNLLEQIERYY